MCTATMPSLFDAIKVTDNAIHNVHQKMIGMDTKSEAFLKLSKNLYYLVERRKLLSTYNEEMVQRIEEINAEINQKIKELEGERSERIANIRHEFGEKTAELPVIEVVVVENDFNQKETSTPTKVACCTVEMVKKYAQKYHNDFKHIPEKNNFFHAAACSFYLKYVSVEFENAIEKHTTEFLSQTKLLPGTQYPLSLTDVDRILHLLNDTPDEKKEENVTVILDASLRVILTNVTNATQFECYTPYVLIYDSESKRFTPVSEVNQSEQMLCFKCFRYTRHEECERICPICLRAKKEYCCFKPSPESKAIICDKCGAFCQTADCYVEHSRICPRPVQPVHDEVLELIKGIMVKTEGL